MLPNQNHKVKIRICSEAIFSSGEKERNLVHSKVLADRYGLVYFHAKSLKGQLKRQAFWLLQQYQSFDLPRAESFFKSIVALFGINREELNLFAPELHLTCPPSHQGIMKFSHLELDEQIRKYFIALQSDDAREGYYKISPHDLIEAQTNIRTGIQLENGVVKDKRMTTCHTVKEGLVFYSSLSFDSEPSAYLGDLQRIIHSLNRIGAGIHRGRGEVEAYLLVDEKEADYVNTNDKEGERYAVL